MCGSLGVMIVHVFDHAGKTACSQFYYAKPCNYQLRKKQQGPLVRMNDKNNTTRGDSPGHHQRMNPGTRVTTRNFLSLENKYYNTMRGDSPHCHCRLSEE